MDMARLVASWSKDRSRKNGCVLVGKQHEVLSVGFNGFPRGSDDDNESRHDRPKKYAWTEHAERNAIYNAARIGVSTLEATAYVTWFPCCDCARALIQAGIKRIVCEGKDDGREPKWDFTDSTEMLTECGVNVEYAP